MIATAPWCYYETAVIELPDRYADCAMKLVEGDELRAYLAEVQPRYGRVISRRRARNLVTDEGARWLLRHAFPPVGQTPNTTAPWYVLPKSTGAIANADTMASHAAWTEITAYSQTARQQLSVPVPSTGRSINNSAAVAQVTANASTTVFGIVLTSISTKSDTTGTLYGGGDFTSSQALTSGQIFQITATVSF